MTASALQSIDLGSFARLWWLPAGGQGNDLDDAAWAPVLELCQRDVPAVLAALRAARVPAYAAPCGSARPSPSHRAADRRSWRLWVGTSTYGTAEAVLLAVMPALARPRDNDGDRS
jgi:hypothetical protein